MIPSCQPDQTISSIRRWTIAVALAVCATHTFASPIDETNLADLQELLQTRFYKYGETDRDPRVMGLCSGFLISSDLVVTAAHCLTHAVMTSGYTPEAPELVYSSLFGGLSAFRFRRFFTHVYDIEHDWALIRLPQEKYSVEPVEIGTVDHMRENQEVIVSSLSNCERGKRDDKGWRKSSPILTKYRVKKIADEIIHLTTDAEATICTGDSGSPAFIYEDDKPILIGVLSNTNAFSAKVQSWKKFEPDKLQFVDTFQAALSADTKEDTKD